MSPLKIFAGCIFCDVSLLAIAWFLLLAIVGFVGLVINLIELYSYNVHRKMIGKTAAYVVSLAHSMLIGTGVSYGLLTRFQTVDGFGHLPTVVAAAVTLVIYIALYKFRHTPKTHMISLSVIAFGALALWLINSEDQGELMLAWTLGLTVISLLGLLLSRIRRKNS